MMRITKRAYLVSFLLLLTLANFKVDAQEMVVPLSGNPVAGLYYKHYSKLKSLSAGSSLELPFIDDFSGTLVEPDQNLWIDRYAYINRNYGIDPVTIGVATLDAVDSDGSIYPNAKIDPQTYEADKLTSRPINLAYSTADSIYLSFFYQPRGLGEEPDSDDSLCVDFFNPADTTWINVWHIPGDTLAPFRQVMIPITDSRFLVDSFQFRFRNLASLPYNDDYFDLRGNVDHWNIDYVRLDKNRTKSDTVIKDVAIIKPLPSMLKENEEIPWQHFEAASNSNIRSSSYITYRNNDSEIRNITRYTSITDLKSGKTITPAQPTSKDIAPYDTTTYEFSQYFQYDFGVGDTGAYMVKAWMRTDTFDNKLNDTITRIQLFRDFYSSDDGSAEAGYGIRGQNTNNGKVAVKFKCYKEDYIGGVDIYFNQTLDSVNLDYYFKLELWSEDSEGNPGPAIYIDENDYTPEYSKQLNGFVRYYFAEPVKVSGTFYAGWMQYNKYLLNVGLDRNTSSTSSRTFYNFTGTWQQSGISGNLMIRPFIYGNGTGTGKTAGIEEEISIYPNPANDLVYINLPGNIPEDLFVDLFDMTGRKITSRELTDGILCVEDLKSGMYIIRVRSGKLQTYTSKLLISR